MWRRLAILADEAQLDAEDLTPLLDLHVDDLGRRRAIVPGEGRAERDDGTGLRHAPGVQHEDSEQIAEFLDRRAWRRGAAAEDELQFEFREIEPGAILLDIGEEVEPDRRNAASLGAAFRLEQHVD